MRIGVPKETAERERRVALVPDVVKALTAKELEVVVESGAGEAASLPRRRVHRGRRQGRRRRLGRRRRRSRSRRPTDEEVGRLKQGQVLIGFLQPLTNADAGEVARRRRA